MLFRHAGTLLGRGYMKTNLKFVMALLPLLPLTDVFAQQLAALDTVVVTANRQPMRVSEVLSDVSTVEREELEMAGHSTLEEILSRQPGMEITANGSSGASSNLLIRGTNSGHVLLLIDGVRVGSATSGNISWSRIPASQIERIEILRGPASSLYGSDAIGGVVQIFTRQSNAPLAVNSEAGMGSYGTRSLNVGVSGRTDGWRYGLNASRYSTEGFNSRPWTSTANPDADGFRNDVLSGRVGYEFLPGHEAGFSFFHSEGENKYDGTGVLNDWRNVTRQSSGNISLKNAITQDWKSTLNIGQSIDKSVGLKDGVFQSNFRTDQLQYAWQNDIRTTVGSFMLAAERLEQSVDTTARYKILERTNDSVLAGWTHGIGAHRLQANLRHDDNSQFGKKNTGSVGYGYRISESWHANTSYGTAFKAPTFNDLYYPSTLSGGITLEGNPNLLPEEAKNREASLHYETGGHLYSATWYLNQIENLIIWPKAGNLRIPKNVSNARLEGVTLAYSGALGSYNLQASYDYLDAKDVVTGKRLPQRAENKATISIGQRLGNWEWRTEAQANGRRFNDESNLLGMGGYALVNLYAAYHVSPDCSVFARVNNFFDRDYVLIDSYATSGASFFMGVRYSPK